MVKTFHIAAQYLATTAISFLDSKADDSHTNLEWKNGVLCTHPLSDHNCVLSLDYKNFSLRWTNDSGYRKEMFLDGKSHSEIITWIRRVSLDLKYAKVYEYKLHYELPYENITSGFIFQKSPEEITNQLIQQRDLAQSSLEEALKKAHQNTAIRIWPHHFDSGSFFVTDNEIGIGLGMAIPDTMIDDFYLYVSGYKGHDAIELPSSTPLEKGAYHNNGWKGFALPVSGISVEEAVDFYTQAIDQYVNP